MSIASPAEPAVLRLRAAVVFDVQAVTTCVKAAYAHWIPRIGREPWPMLQDYAVVIETEHVVVAESNGQLAGVLVLSETPDGFLLDNVAVSPEHKGQGVGQALLIHAEREARSRGYSSIYLYTNEKMDENIG